MILIYEMFTGSIIAVIFLKADVSFILVFGVLVKTRIIILK